MVLDLHHIHQDASPPSQPRQTFGPPGRVSDPFGVRPSRRARDRKRVGLCRQGLSDERGVDRPWPLATLPPVFLDGCFASTLILPLGDMRWMCHSAVSRLHLYFDGFLVLNCRLCLYFYDYLILSRKLYLYFDDFLVLYFDDFLVLYFYDSLILSRKLYLYFDDFLVLNCRLRLYFDDSPVLNCGLDLFLLQPPPSNNSIIATAIVLNRKLRRSSHDSLVLNLALIQQGSPYFDDSLVLDLAFI
ncbi:hypothetical protein B0T10DRAFT_457402 [Thelonectria olida]|uniref:Uncharacterized protein n=1 Tax=Thelonectria olida TaxID=1576542 RepID=A0A9P9AUX3_9HYPO|nr:hypothetical protein B0T10DRAFT_457402 [Thelonectria olida]